MNNDDNQFDYEGQYWRRMNGITPPPIILKELYENSDEDPYSNVNFYSGKKYNFEYSIDFYTYNSTEKINIDKNNKDFNYLYYFKFPYSICEYLYCNNFNNVFKKTFVIFAGYVF
jgi:hypothetical protein